MTRRVGRRNAPKPLEWPGLAGFDIDGAFLFAHEGTRSEMYVPLDAEGRVLDQSGPTIGRGVDLGSKDLAYLRTLGLPADLQARLSPYLGLRRAAARAFVERRPLLLADAERDTLDAAVQARELGLLADRFDAASKVGPFRRLPRNTQTAIASLYFQYGCGDPVRSTPNYWRQITTGDWRGAHRNLQDFQDRYPTRRRAEAALLWADILAGRLPRTA